MPRKDYLYQHYTWPELGKVAKKQPVVVVPIGSVEDHGPHLPLDVDNFLIWEICEAAAQRAGGDILLMPIIPFGYETHHMDFHGTIDIQMEHLLHFVLDVTKSVAHHGFERILIADGHGSNMPILELGGAADDTRDAGSVRAVPVALAGDERDPAAPAIGPGRYVACLRTRDFRVSVSRRGAGADGQGAQGDWPAGVGLHLERPDRSRSYSDDGLLDVFLKVGN